MSIVYSGVIFSIASFAMLLIGILCYSILDGKFDMRIDNSNTATLTSFAGFFIGLSLVLANSLSGESETGLMREITMIFEYLMLGFFMLMISKPIFDKVVMQGIDVVKQLSSNNVAVGIVDSANFIATGFIVFATLHWYDISTLEGISMTIIFYVIAMLMFTFYGLVYNKVDSEVNKKILSGDVRCAFERGINRIVFAVSTGIGFAIMQDIYNPNSIVLIFSWIIVSFLVFFAIRFSAKIVSMVAFNKEDDNVKVGRSIIKFAIILPAPFFFM